MTLSFKTNQLKARKQVEIDGHHYTVRRMGNIEQLEMSANMRRLNKLAKKEKSSKLTDKELSEVEGISSELADMMIALFDDHGDQSKSRSLVRSLTDEEISELMDQIFSSKEDSNGTEEKTD